MGNVAPDQVNVKWKHPESEKLIMMQKVVSEQK